MAGVASMAIFAASAAKAQSYDELAQRIDALEEELQNAEMHTADALNNPPPAPSGWWSNTSISGRMYFDVTNIENKVNGVKSTAATAANGTTNGNGTNFDIKRFYIGIDHTFNSIFSANVTTDVTYDGGAGAGQLYLKKAYLQAKVDPALIVRIGATDLPWVPYAEGIYGYRYLENTLIDRTKFGTSSDWGVHVLGALFDGMLNYDFAAINGGGYKKFPGGGDVNRFDQFDFEGRISAVYDGFNVAVGGYTGKLGTPYGVTTHHTAERFDAMAAYVANGLRLGVEYFDATDYSAALVASATPGDAAHGVSGFGSYFFTPEWGVFGRYDSVDPNTKTAPARHDDYYTFGVTWHPTQIVDFSLAYKHDEVSHGTLSTSNGTIGGSTNGEYNEIGIFGDFQF
jgi:hypothetical protein